MKRGPRPKSAALKLRQGTFRRHACDLIPRTPGCKPGVEGDLRGEALSPPTWLSPLAIEEWHRVVGDLESQGRLANVDVSMLAGFCQEMGTYRRLTVWLDQHGHVYELPNGISALRPESKLADASLKNAIRLAAEFGLTPSARTRTNTELVEEAPDWRKSLA